MAKNESFRIRPKQLVIDISSYSALEGITKYNPMDKSYSMDKGKAKKQTMDEMRGEETRALAALKTFRDKATAAEWDFHNYILGAKIQVSAQFGDSSNELQALGVKKKTEYKSRSSKKKG